MNRREIFSQKIDLLLALTDENNNSKCRKDCHLLKNIIDDICEITGNTKLYFTFPNLL